MIQMLPLASAAMSCTEFIRVWVALVPAVYWMPRVQSVGWAETPV